MRRVYTPKSPREQVKEILLAQIRALRQSIDPELLKKAQDAAIAAQAQGQAQAGKPAAGPLAAGPVAQPPAPSSGTVASNAPAPRPAPAAPYANGGLAEEGENSLSYDRKHAAATVAAYLNLNRNLDRAQLVEIIKMVKDIR